jgi:hypothetical protein
MVALIVIGIVAVLVLVTLARGVRVVPPARAPGGARVGG